MRDSEKCEQLEKEATELRHNVWIWKGISFVLLVLYVFEVGGLLG
jgi:predicted nucleic acid-binding Zn ribbon protein